MKKQNSLNLELKDLKEELIQELLEIKLSEAGSLYANQNMLKQSLSKKVDDLIDFTPKRMQAGLKALIDRFVILNGDEPNTYKLSYIEELKQLSQLSNYIYRMTPSLEESPISDDECPSIASLINLSGEALNAFVIVGEHLLSEKNYAEASDLFFFLSNLDGEDPRFLIGIGSAEFYAKNYEDAAIAFQLAQLADPYMAQSYVFEAHCQEALNNLDKASHLLEDALKLVEDDEFKSGIKAYLTQLEKKF